MDPATLVAAGFGLGLVLALSSDTLLYLVEALWLRRSRSVAVAATLGAAVGDSVLIAAGGWIGCQVVAVVESPGTRASLAIGLFVGLAAKALLSRVLFGAKGVPGNAELPAGPGSAFGRCFLTELFMLTPAILAAGVVIAWPGLWAPGAAGPLVVAVVLGGVLWRLVWASDGRGRRRKWGSRAIPDAVTILTVGLLAGMAVWAMPR